MLQVYSVRSIPIKVSNEKKDLVHESMKGKVLVVSWDDEESIESIGDKEEDVRAWMSIATLEEVKKWVFRFEYWRNSGRNLSKGS